MTLATKGTKPKRTETERLFEVLCNKAPVGVCIIQDGKFCYINPTFQSNTGYRQDELLGKDSLEIVVPEDRQRVRENVIKTLKGKLTLPYEFRVVHKDGSIHWVVESLASIQYRGRRATLASFVDITERKQAEEALQAEKNKLQSLIDAMSDGLSIQDTEYNIIFQNEVSKASSGGDRVGEKCYRVFEGQDKVCDGCPVKKAFKDGKSHIAERMRTLPSGEVTFWENTANPIKDAEGRIVACLEVGRNITERKRMEQALADEATRRRILIDQSLDGIVVLDEDAAVVEANQRFAEMLGYTLEEVRKLHTWDWDKQFPPEKLLEMGRAVDEKGFHLETKHTRKDGSVFDVDISINAAMFRGQKLIFCVCRDVSARKKMEEAVRNSEEKLREMFESVTDGISLIDLKGIITEVNQRTVEMHGFSSKDELLGKNAFELVAPSDRETVAAAVKKAIKQGATRRVECTLFRADGSEFPGELSTSVLKDASGNLIGHVTVARDITERKKMEEALKLAAEEWKETFDSISDAISIHDRDFRIQLANKAFANMFNTDLSQVIGKHCYELHKGEKPHSGCPHQQTLATGKPAAAEFYESHLGKYLLESTSPILDKRGEVIGTVHVTRDITAQKQQHERLMMADRLASLGELAAGTAHELNNPLTSIIGFSQLLKERDIPDDLREDVEFIYNEAQRAANVTKNLLTFARKHTPVKQLSQINNIIEDVLKLRAYELKVNSIEVKKQLAPDLPEIMVDRFQMQQVFLNIIINAEYFMTEAHNRGTLTITTKKQNSNVMISFADDGPGIPPENLGRVFDPFFTTKPAGKGTGLGLSICHGIVAEHGGQIYARSELGEGATFIIELPITTP
ncbi:MAG: PAS domain S-box protein [Chloroflexi bacterium]|nr:PAS domain S-box protein [Chloroflexota bacterium]